MTLEERVLALEATAASVFTGPWKQRIVALENATAFIWTTVGAVKSLFGGILKHSTQPTLAHNPTAIQAIAPDVPLVPENEAHTLATVPGTTITTAE